MTETHAVSETPFRLTLVFVDGDELEFPVYVDAARDNVKAAALWRDAPFNASIIDQVEDRETLFWAIVRLYTHLARNAEGAFYMVDADGRSWGIVARSVRAVRVEDPEAKNRKPKRSLGFTVGEERERPPSPAV